MTSLAATHPHLLSEWHPDNEVKPTEILAGSRLALIKWQCSNGHIWEAFPAQRTQPDRPNNCPYCIGKRLDGTNSLADLYPQVARHWHPDNPITPSEVRPGANIRVKWICDEGHISVATVVGRVNLSRAYNGDSCPDCARAKRIQRLMRMHYPDWEADIAREEQRDYD